MTEVEKHNDRRIERTRQLLRQASIEVLQEKGFKHANIQDITSRANLNRGTFYAHFSDKYALLEELVREEFAHTVSVLPPVTQWRRDDLLKLIQLLLEDFEKVYRTCHPLGKISPPIEEIIREELENLLLQWLRAQKTQKATVPRETIARSMSWSILGEALQWSKEPAHLSSFQAAKNLLVTLVEGVERNIPDIFHQ